MAGGVRAAKGVYSGGYKLPHLNLIKAIQTLALYKWCPGADLNHRHEDFQSTALPLSYPGMGFNDQIAIMG